MTGACLWCAKSFAPHKGGSIQRFCSASHRRDFHAAIRVYAERAVEEGALTIDELKSGDPAAFTVHANGEAGNEASTVGEMSPEKHEAWMQKLLGLHRAIFESDLSEDEMLDLPAPVLDLIKFLIIFPKPLL